MKEEQLNQIIADVWAAIKETDQKIKTNSEELSKRFKETDREIKEVSKMVGGLTHRWGIFVENILAPGLPAVFQEWGIPMRSVSQRVKARINGDKMEIDMLCLNKDYVILVEVKSSLGVDDIKDHVERLKNFKRFFPEYSNKKILGAVAGIEIVEEADRFAYKQGFFVIAQKGEMAVITNDKGFKPKEW